MTLVFFQCYTTTAPIPHCPNAAPSLGSKMLSNKKRTPISSRCSPPTVQSRHSNLMLKAHCKRTMIAMCNTFTQWSSKLFQTLFPRLVQGLIPCLWGVHGWPSGTTLPQKKHGNVQPAKHCWPCCYRHDFVNQTLQENHRSTNSASPAAILNFCWSMGQRSPFQPTCQNLIDLPQWPSVDP